MNSHLKKVKRRAQGEGRFAKPYYFVRYRSGRVSYERELPNTPYFLVLSAEQVAGTETDILEGLIIDYTTPW